MSISKVRHQACSPLPEPAAQGTDLLRGLIVGRWRRCDVALAAVDLLTLQQEDHLLPDPTEDESPKLQIVGGLLRIAWIKTPRQDALQGLYSCDRPPLSLSLFFLFPPSFLPRFSPFFFLFLPLNSIIITPFMHAGCVLGAFPCTMHAFTPHNNLMAWKL